MKKILKTGGAMFPEVFLKPRSLFYLKNLDESAAS
jgi:hypothetical protein